MAIVKVQIESLEDMHKCKVLCLVVKMTCEANVCPVACGSVMIFISTFLELKPVQVFLFGNNYN